MVVGTTSTGVPWEWGLPLSERYIIFGATVILWSIMHFVSEFSAPVTFRLIPYCMHFALRKALIFMTTVGLHCILLSCQHYTIEHSWLNGNWDDFHEHGVTADGDGVGMELMSTIPCHSLVWMRIKCAGTGGISMNHDHETRIYTHYTV